MKKFLSLALALLMAFSAATVGFAGLEDLTCDTCKAKLADEKAYNAHVNGGCLVDFKTCQYCGARVATADLEDHEGQCPKGASTCDKCGAEFANEDAAEGHECDTKDIAKTAGQKVLDTLAEVDWEGVFNKVVDAVKSIDFDAIIAKIKPVIEKVVDFVKNATAA